MPWKRNTLCQPSRGRRGTALLEFVMAVPLLALIIMLTFFFGWAMMNQQHVKVSDRYTTWRELRAAAVGGGDLNALFFDERASVSISRDTGSTEILEALAGEVGALGEPAGELARRTVLGGFPRGRTTQVAAEFETSIDAWRQFSGAIRSRYARDGVAWRRGQARAQDAIRQELLPGLDGMLSGVPPPAERLSRTIQRLYLVEW